MGKITRKTMFKAAGYAVGGLFLLGGLGGNLSALALGLGVTSGMLFGSNAFGLRRHVPLLRSPNAWARRGGYAILWTLTLLVGAVLPTQTPAQIRAAQQVQ